MAMGKCQIDSDCTAQQNVIESENIGLIFPAEDINSFADQIMKLYNDGSLREEMEKNAIRSFETKYNWENIQKALLKLYESL